MVYQTLDKKHIRGIGWTFLPPNFQRATHRKQLSLHNYLFLCRKVKFSLAGVQCKWHLCYGKLIMLIFCYVRFEFYDLCLFVFWATVSFQYITLFPFKRKELARGSLHTYNLFGKRHKRWGVKRERLLKIRKILREGINFQEAMKSHYGWQDNSFSSLCRWEENFS